MVVAFDVGGDRTIAPTSFMEMMHDLMLPNTLDELASMQALSSAVSSMQTEISPGRRR